MNTRQTPYEPWPHLTDAQLAEHGVRRRYPGHRAEAILGFPRDWRYQMGLNLAGMMFLGWMLVTVAAALLADCGLAGPLPVFPSSGEGGGGSSGSGSSGSSGSAFEDGSTSGSTGGSSGGAPVGLHDPMAEVHA